MIHLKEPAKPLKLQTTCLWHQKNPTYLKNYGTQPIQLPLTLPYTPSSLFFPFSCCWYAVKSIHTTYERVLLLPIQFLQFAVVGAQTASTDNRFITFGHGSCPKLLFDTVTVHLAFPIHFCQNETKTIINILTKYLLGRQL